MIFKRNKKDIPRTKKYMRSYYSNEFSQMSHEIT